MSDAPIESIERFKSFGINIFFIDNLIKEGRESKIVTERQNKDSVIYIMSTSGSTGYPKSALLTNKSIMYDSVIEVGFVHDHFKEGSCMLNNILFAFGSSLAMTCIMIGRGHRIMFMERKCANILEEIRIADPTFITLSPMAYNKFYKGIMANIHRLPENERDNALKIIDIKTRYYRVTGKYSHPILDKLIYPLRQKIFGDRLRFLANIGASITNEVLTFFRILTGLPFVNVYASSEIAGSLCVSSDTDPAEIIGAPEPWYECKLIDVPEKGYFVTDVIDGKPCPRGEICVRNFIMGGYLNDPEKTKEILDSEGWLKTGDIAILREDFKLQIIDRKNQVMKLTCGEYISFDKTESLYENNKYVSQILVYADNSKNYPIGLIVPQTEALLQLAIELGLPQDINLLCADKKIEAAVVEDLKRVGISKEALYFEYLPRVLLINEPFTQKNGFMTGTFKLRRAAIINKYREQIDRIYKEDTVDFMH